ncbi:MAG: magnesium transporter [Burkholderiales bacterium]|nr:magnesium transporter [Anaerolineae bacterium]
MEHMSMIALEILEQQVHDALEYGEFEGLAETLNSQRPADVADVLERLNEDERVQIFQLLESELAGEVLTEMGSHATREIIENLTSEAVGDLFDMMEADDVAEILSEDVPELKQELLAAMEPEEAADVHELLQFPEDSAGRLMTDRFVHVTADMSAAQALDWVRKVNDDVETVNDLYVMNGGSRLIGVVSLRQVLNAAPEGRVGDFMVTQIVTVPPDMDQEEVARLVARYNFLAMPVVSATGRMLGIITVDDVIDVLVHEGTEDALKFAGIEGDPDSQPYFTVPILRVIRKRIVWLFLLFFAETLTGGVLRLFGDELASVVALSFFIPLLIGTGGNTGAQTVSTVIRGLALKEIRVRDAWRVLGRELSSGFLIGAILGVASFGRALLWGTETNLALVVGLAIVVICTWSNTIGSFIPLAAEKFGVDPALVSAPLITTLVDATGLAIYMLIAKAILGI